jgi:hypothetical protein
LVRAHRKTRVEEIAPSQMSTAEIIISLVRSLGDLEPAVDDPARAAMACTLAIKLKPGPPDVWPGETAAVLCDIGIEITEDELRAVKRSRPYAEFCAEFDGRPAPEDEPAYEEHLYRMRALMIEAGSTE